MDSLYAAERRYYRVTIGHGTSWWRVPVFLDRGVLRFSASAHGVLAVAPEEARKLGHDYVGTEHILLALIHDADSAAARPLMHLGVSLEAIRQQVEEVIGLGEGTLDGVPDHPPFTPLACRVLQLARREALRLGSGHIGGEHLLLGTVAEGDGVAAQVLVRMGANLTRVRAVVRRRQDT